MTKRNKSCESEVMLTMQRKELLKKSAIRYAEYYGMVEVQDALYADSASEKIFTNLISIIGSDANIKMAYRNLKSNKGSSTPGVDGKTFKDFHRNKLLAAALLLLWQNPLSCRKGELWAQN